MSNTTNTYAGTTLKVVAQLPATNDAAGFGDLTFIGGECSLRSVPSVGITYNEVSEDLVCAEVNTDVKASAKYKPWEFPLAIKAGDPLQAIMRDALADRVAVISVELTFPGAIGKVYAQVQVSMFDIVGGGGQNAIIDANVKLLPQQPFVYVQ